MWSSEFAKGFWVGLGVVAAVVAVGFASKLLHVKV